MEKKVIEVQFRKHKGEIIAVFPYIIENINDVMCYTKNTMHGTCDWNISYFSKPATKAQYQELLNELTNIYAPEFELKVIRKRNHTKYLKAYFTFRNQKLTTV